MRTMCSREIFTKKCRQQQIFDSDLKGAWHYNHVTFTPIAKNFMLYCRLIYMLSILCVRLTIKVKVGIPESFKVGWYPPPQKKLGRVTLKVLMVSSMWRSGLERITTKKRVKRALSSFKGAIPLVLLFFFVFQANFHDLRCAFFLGPRRFLLEQTYVPKYAWLMSFCISTPFLM